MRFWRKSLLVRLLSYFLLLAVIPLVIIGAIAYNQGQRSLQENILAHLTTTAILKEDSINRWVTGASQDVQLLTEDPFILEQTKVLLTQDEESDEFVAAYQALKARLDWVLDTKPDLLEIMILHGVGGKVLVSTNAEHEGNYEVTSSFFTEGRKGLYIQDIYPSVSLGRSAVTIAAPVRAEQNEGVLAAHLNLDKLGEIMTERSGLGETGETYLVDSVNVFVSAARFGRESFPRGVHTEGIDQALSGNDGGGIYVNYRGVPVIGAYRWLDERDMALLAEIELEEALLPVRRLALVILLVGIGVTALVAAVAFWVSRQISRPVLAMAETSTQMADGDLSQRVDIEREDEIGVLAHAFDDMADQLDGLISTLEERVADRTRALEQRAVQLATAADVGRAAASILDLETLAHQVVDLIRRRFGFYYTGLFLVDDAGRYAVLEAGTGEPGRIMKEQGHKLRVGGVSMVGAACAQHEARIALDVGAEAVRFDNPLLPGTRSEMALPLVVGDRVLGALDVQSTEPAAFSEEDIAVLQLVADQVAVAVDNAHKFSEEATLLEAANPLFRVSRRLAAANTTGEIVQAILSSVAETEADGCAVALFGPAEGQDGKADTVTFLGAWHRWREPGVPLGVPLPVEEANFPPSLATSFWTVEDVSEDERISEARRRALVENEVWAVVNVPLRLGDSVIGFVDVQRATAGPFSPVSVRLYETLTDQAAVALERGRLLEESQRRAEREQMLSQMTARFTRSLDIDTLLQAAARELGQLPDVAEASVYIGIPGGAPPANGDEMEQNE